MDLLAVTLAVVATSVLACIAVENALSIVAKRTDFRFLLTGVLGIPVCGTIVTIAVILYPDAFSSNSCFVLGIEALTILLAASFLSYYLCALVSGFLRMHAERLKSGKKDKVEKRKKRSRA